MSRFEIGVVLMAALPAAALWLSWPRRAWIARVAAFLSGIAGVAGFMTLPAAEHGAWSATAAMSLLACLYASYVVSRGEREYVRLEQQYAKRKAKRDEVVGNLALARARCRDIEAEQREVHALYGMVKSLAESRTFGDLRPKLENAVEQYLGVSEFALYVVEDADAGRLEALIRKKISSSLGGSWTTLKRYLQERSIALSVPHIVSTPEAAVGVPVFEDSRVSGYLYARLPEGAEAERLLNKAQAFAEEIAFTFQRVRLYQEMERHSQIDGLTGVYRRGVLDEKLAEEVVRARTFKTTFCLMILDIDHFKSLNDNYGHQFGDHVLQRVGRILKDSVYETDFVARYGGEEFAIMLPRAEPSGVLRKAEAVRRAIEAATFELAMQQVRITVSIGVAHFPRDASSAPALVKQADQALYSAKERGRNQVVDISGVRKSL